MKGSIILNLLAENLITASLSRKGKNILKKFENCELNFTVFLIKNVLPAGKKGFREKFPKQLNGVKTPSWRILGTKKCSPKFVNNKISERVLTN